MVKGVHELLRADHSRVVLVYGFEGLDVKSKVLVIEVKVID